MLRTKTHRYLQNKLPFLRSFQLRAMLRKATPGRLLRALFAVVEWKRHRPTCASRPFAFRIEASAACNLRCPLCSTTYRQFGPGEKRSMTLPLFETILTKIEHHAWRVTFYMEGEPMMNPQLFDMVRLCGADRRMFTSFSSNLTLMRDRLLDPLFQSGIDWISVSLDGLRQATYEKYRVNGRVDDVLHGIAAIMARRKSEQLRYPYMEVNMIDFAHIPAEERNELEAFCETHGVDEFRVRPDQFGLMGTYEPTIVREPPAKCHWPWSSMSIDCDGSVYACPIAFEQRMPYGNLATSSLDEIWNSDLYVATRTYLGQAEDQREGLPKLPCYDCRWYGKTPPRTDVVAIRKQWMAVLHTSAEGSEPITCRNLDRFAAKAVRRGSMMSPLEGLCAEQCCLHPD